MKYLIVTLSLLFIVILAYCYYYAKWHHLWSLEKPLNEYSAIHNQDDTLRVVMIGDSWAGMHTEFDSFISKELEKLSGHQVFFESKGKGGEKTKGVYRLMFEDDSYGTRSLISAGPDYCVISAGINDAAANLGTKQFCHYYRQILTFLIKNHIRPVIIEVPNIDLWLMLGEKPIMDLVSDFVKSVMTGCGMYNYQEYRDALLAMLKTENYMEHILFIPMKEWNGDGIDINKKLFLDDRIHLNRIGYESIDSCIALHVANDYRSCGKSRFD